MAVDIDDVRAELQLPVTLISDKDITYVINKVTADDINVVCAEVLRMVQRRYRGKTKIKVGKSEDTIDHKEIKSLIRFYTNRASGAVLDDGFEFPDSTFTRDSI